jgi:ubiquinone/menaquinone biosynthesis C-methylase UbiE
MLPMEKLQQDKEKLLAGFDLFLKKNLKVGDTKGTFEWLKTSGKELNSRFPMSKADSFSDKQMRELFELMGPHYGEFTSLEDQREIMTELLDCEIIKGRTLSIGCGLAPHEIYLSAQGLIGEIVGIDTSSSVLKRAKDIAKKEGVKAQFVQNYGSSISYKNEFDQVLLIDSLHWMKGWKQCIIKSAEALKEEGTLFLVYSLFSPAVKINPKGVATILREQKVNITEIKGVEGHVETPRVVIVAKKG